MLNDDEINQLTTDKALFTEKIQQIKQNMLPGMLDNKPVYCLLGEQNRYLQIQTVEEAPNYFGIIVDRTEVIRERMQLERERDFDLLTGLMNRRGFYHQLDILLDTMNAAEHGVLMMLDMDHLKYINDAFGHAGGDIALRAAGDLLMKYAIDSGIAARLSGDEFVLFLKGESKDDLYEKIHALQQEYKNIELNLAEDQTASLRFSGGYVFVESNGETRQVIMKKADKALYRAKNSGRGHLLEYDARLDGIEIEE